MKKTLRIFSLLLIAIMGISLTSCGDDQEEDLKYDKLPETARTFISTYFPNKSVISSRKEKNEYEVILTDGTRIDFNKDGEWTDVDAERGATIPSGFYPAPIDTYVAANYSSTGINEISKETYGYDVELVTGLDLRFSAAGDFISIDY